MTGLRRLPVRWRLTLAFAASMSALLLVCGALIHVLVAATLLDELETGLRARAAALETDLDDPGFRLATPSPALLEPTEAFVQVVAADGRLIDSTPGVVAVPLPSVSPGSTNEPRWFEASIPGVVGTARILAVPAQRQKAPVTLVVGASMSDREDALRRLDEVLLAGAPSAVLAASVLGWFLSRAAVRPMERMRAEASAISVSGLDHRLSVPSADDELRRLAVTLNEMLGRIDAASRSERRFLDDASHQLRTPLTALTAELELALRRPRTQDELLDALRSARSETARLTELAEGLLLDARTNGRLAVRRTPVTLSSVLSSSANRFAGRARAAGVDITVRAPDSLVRIDAARVEQSLDNLLDNALRYAPSGSTVNVSGAVNASGVEIGVQDQGPGFAAAPTRSGGHGLGLAFVTATAAAHGGTVSMHQVPTGGAQVLITLADGAGPHR